MKITNIWEKMRSCLRNFILSTADRTALDAWQAYLHPVRHIYLQDGRLWNPKKSEGNTLTWGKDVEYGWIQGISRQGPTLTINHFAIDKSYLGTGLGTRLAYAFGQAVKLHAGITHIRFTEHAQTPAYATFFVNRLKAQQLPSTMTPGLFEWLWQIP